MFAGHSFLQPTVTGNTHVLIARSWPLSKLDIFACFISCTARVNGWFWVGQTTSDGSQGGACRTRR